MLIAEPLVLNSYLVENFVEKIPESLDTIEDMEEAGHLLGKTTNNFTYLMATLNTFKIMVKKIKATGTKPEADEMITRRDIIQIVADISKQQYNAISRMITVKQEINNELKMGEAK